MTAALAGLNEAGADDALGAAACDQHGVAGFGSVRRRGWVETRGEQPFRVLADDQQVDGAGGVVFQGRVVLVEEIDRAEAAIEIELLAQVELRRHLDAGGPAHVGQSHGAEQDGVEFLGALEGGGRQGVARAEVLAGADAERFEFKRDWVAGGNGMEDADGLGSDLGADAVAGHESDAVSFHGSWTTWFNSAESYAAKTARTVRR